MDEQEANARWHARLASARVCREIGLTNPALSTCPHCGQQQWHPPDQEVAVCGYCGDEYPFAALN